MVTLHQPRPPQRIVVKAARHVAYHRQAAMLGAACRRCGCVLAADNPGDLCAPCVRRPPYDPRSDGAFAGRLAAYLVANRGRWCDPSLHFGVPTHLRDAVWQAVRKLRRGGWVIEGRARGGYRLRRDGVRSVGE
jgi:hypothetical protein